MKKWMLAVVLGVLLACSGGVRAADEPAPILRMQKFMCPSQTPIAIIQGKVGGQVYGAYLNPASLKMIVIYYDGSGDPVKFWFGQLDPTATGLRFGAGEMLTVAQARVKYPSPCDFVAPMES